VILKIRKDEYMRKVILTLCIAGLMAVCVSCKSTKQPETTIEETTVQVSLNELYEAVKEAYGENYLPQMPYDAELFANTFGITEDLYEEFVAESPMISAQVDIFVGIKAKEGKADEIEQALSSYQENLVNNSLQYPMNLGKVEGARIYRNGDYVFYFILGGYPEDVDEIDVEIAKKQNQLAIDTIEGLLGKADQ